MAAKTTDPIDILLEMGIDLDNLSEEEDYLSALKEAIATIEFKTGGKGDERSAALREEVIKVRKSRRAADPKIKAKKTTIKPENLFERSAAPKQKTLSTSAIVPYKGPESEEEGVKKKRVLREKTSDPLKDILKSVNSILATLKNQNKITKKQAERDRKDAERAKRGAQEDDLEQAPLKKFFDNAKKLAKPAIGFFESIMNFIMKVLIGRLLVKILNWMGDPENKKKMDAIMDFFKVTWPAFLAAFLAFKFGLLGFMGGLIGLIGRFIPKILGLIPKMLKGLKTLAMGNPLATAAVAVVAGTAIAAVAANQDGTAVIKDPDDPDKSQADEIREFGGMTGAPISGDMLGFNLGGLVPGSGPDKDTVPAMLTPGEFVMSRGAVQKYGSDTLAGMNAMGGGTNEPSSIGTILGYNGGGLVDEKAQRPKTSATDGGGSPDEFAKPMIKIHEGLRLDKYMDSRGFPTIGYGHLIEPGESMPNRISQQKADELFDEDYTHHKAAAMRIPGYDRANAMQKAALIDLTFNMGPAWADDFPKFKQAFAAGNYEQAGNELIDSAYYGQVGRRGPTIVNLIKGKGADNVAYLKGVPTPAPGPSSSQPQIASVGSVGDGQRLSDLSAAQSTRSGGSAPPSMSYAGSSRSLPPPSRGTRLSDLRKNQEMRAASGQEPKEYPNPGALNTPNSNDLPPIDANAMISMEKIKVLGLTVV